MTATARADAFVETVLNHAGETRYIHNYVGRSAVADGGPQGFLVGMPPDNEGKAHFHGTDQFQIFFALPGAVYQRTPMGEVMVHYSDGYTTYGPFTSGEGLEFFTLRAMASDLTSYMPEGRSHMVGRSGRNVHATVDVARVWPPPGDTVMDTVIAMTDDAMASWSITSGPGASFELPPASDGSGQYYCVVAGEVLEAGQRLGRQSLGWRGPEEPGPSLVAGDGGGQVVVVQFPSPDHLHRDR